jgi:hypothetical protein
MAQGCRILAMQQIGSYLKYTGPDVSASSFVQTLFGDTPVPSARYFSTDR